MRQKYDKAESPPEVVDRIDFPQPPDRYMQSIFDDLDVRSGSGVSPDEFDRVVAKIGSRLWDDLFHDDGFKAFYWKHLQWVSTMQIVSDEPHVPWEILRPFYRNWDDRWEAKGFLCERHAVARWLSGPTPARRIDAHKVAIVCPPSNLKYVVEEVEAIKSIPGLQVEIIGDKPVLETFFVSGEAEIVHFACHGQFDAAAPARSALRLGDRYLSPYEMTAEYRNFGRSDPLVFVNACESGRLGIGLTGIDGWAEVFLKADVGAFVGSTWDTTDDLAAEFVKVFYALLCQGYRVGEAMRSARREIRRAGDATYLSYTLYANPQMILALPRERADLKG